jgi:hypothetical protein
MSRLLASGLLGIMSLLGGVGGEDAQFDRGHAQARVNPSDWELQVVGSGSIDNTPSATAGFWLGLRNNTSEAKVVCIVQIQYSIDDDQRGLGSSDDVKGISARRSPHACAERTGTHLVLPGETLFTYGGVPVPSWALDSQEVLFRATAAVSCREPQCERQWIILKGSGRLGPSHRSP